MLIHLVSTSLPSQNGKGFEIVLYQRICALLEDGYEVELLVSCIGKVPAKSLLRSRNLFSQHKNFKVRIFPIKFMQLLLNGVRSVYDIKVPLQVQLYTQKKIVEYIDNRNPDIVICNLIRTSGCTPNNFNNLILDAVDSMTLNFQRRVKVEKSIIKNMIFRIELSRLRTFETNLKKFQKVVTVAEEDRSYFRKSNCVALPLGVTPYVRSSALKKSEKNFCFTGNMGYAPNLDAAKWLIEDLWPEILSLIPDASLHIAGRNSEILGASEKNVNIVGEVENMQNFLQNMDVAIAPMRQGSGMQFKILEALAVGLPVCCTKLGIGSIEAPVNSSVFLFDNQANIGAAALRALNTNAQASEIRRYVHDHHSWTAINRRFIDETLMLNS